MTITGTQFVKLMSVGFSEPCVRIDKNTLPLIGQAAADIIGKTIRMNGTKLTYGSYDVILDLDISESPSATSAAAASAKAAPSALSAAASSSVPVPSSAAETKPVAASPSTIVKNSTKATIADFITAQNGKFPSQLGEH
jgi:hypothetical protein